MPWCHGTLRVPDFEVEEFDFTVTVVPSKSGAAKLGGAQPSRKVLFQKPKDWETSLEWWDKVYERARKNSVLRFFERFLETVPRVAFDAATMCFFVHFLFLPVLALVASFSSCLLHPIASYCLRKADWYAWSWYDVKWVKAPANKAWQICS